MCVYIIWEKVMLLGLKGYVVDYILQSPHSFRTDSTVAEEHLGRKKKKDGPEESAISYTFSKKIHIN